MIFHSTPFKEDDIGGGINEIVSLLPGDAWVCLRDGDTMFLTSDWGVQVRDIVDSAKFDLIGCKSNRIGLKDQQYQGLISDDPDISNHLKIAADLRDNHWAEVTETFNPIAGQFMLFRKSMWERVGGFQPNTILFDKMFSRDVVNAGGRLGVAQGIYLFHLYRFGQPDPQSYVEHLRGMRP